jgi:hypothetical protein
VYGVLGLVGFLAQMVIGVQARLLAMFAWYQAMARTAPQPPTLAPGEMPDRTLQAIGLVLWIGGVPLLAAGFYLDAGRLLSAGAWCLFCATGVSAINAAIVLRHAFPPQASQVIRRLRRLRRLVGGAEACKHETARGDASGPGSARILAFVTADKSSTVVLPDNRRSHPGPLPDSRHGHRLNQRHRRISAGDVVAQ